MIEAKRSVLQVLPEELGSWMAGRGHRPYHASQVFRWIFERRAEAFGGMSDVPSRLREELEAEWSIFSTTVSRHLVAPDGTDKLLLECRDGRRIECVLMAEEDRRTVCVSTQVGCGMGCVFCASGLKGVERNLTRGEIVEQVVRLRNLLPTEERLTNLVVMGMGESLANLDNLIAGAGSDLLGLEGLKMGQRRVTISTVGLPEKMRKLAAMDRSSTTWRSRCTPRPRPCATSWCRSTRRSGCEKWWMRPTSTSGAAAGGLPSSTCCFGGSTTASMQAKALADLLEARKAHVNLIPYNPVDGLPFERPSTDAVRRFEGIVRSRGIKRERAEDQGARDRRGVRATPPARGGRPGWGGGPAGVPDGSRAETLTVADDRGGPLATGESLEAQLEARDPDVRLMLQIRDDVPGRVRGPGRAVPAPAGRGPHAPDRPGRRGGGPDAGRLPADLSGPQGVQAEGEVLDLAVHDRQQPGDEPPPRQSRGRNPAVAMGMEARLGPADAGLRPLEERALARDGTPSAEMRQVELSDVVREALDVLGEDQKMAVLLNKFEDMSYADIAEVMGRSEAAVKSLLARARTHLREQLEPYLKTGQRATLTGLRGSIEGGRLGSTARLALGGLGVGRAAVDSLLFPSLLPGLRRRYRRPRVLPGLPVGIARGLRAELPPLRDAGRAVRRRWRAAARQCRGRSMGFDRAIALGLTRGRSATSAWASSTSGTPGWPDGWPT